MMGSCRCEIVVFQLWTCVRQQPLLVATAVTMTAMGLSRVSVPLALCWMMTKLPAKVGTAAAGTLCI